MSAFEYFILIGVIPNYSTCFHIIFKIKSIKHIKKFTILIQIFTLKHENQALITLVMPHLFENVP
jgi:hypothetical protein